MSFEVFRAEPPGPLVVEIPHAGVALDPRAGLRIPASALEAGVVLADSDVGAAALWEGAEAAGITRIVATVSRLVVDLNTEPRLPTPYEEKLPDGLREIRRRSMAGVVWYDLPPPRAELERRLREHLEPYHAAIDAELERARRAAGRAVLLSAHTYPDALYPRAADAIVGARGGATAPRALQEAVAAHLRAAGLSVALDEPFPGGYSVARHAERAPSLQLELARRLVCAPGDPRRPTLDPAALDRLRPLLLSLPV